MRRIYLRACSDVVIPVPAGQRQAEGFVDIPAGDGEGAMQIGAEYGVKGTVE